MKKRAAKFRHSFPAWRVFVFGVEVTDDVVSCNTNQNDSRSPNTAEFVLSSLRDRYIVTREDLYALYPNLSIENLPTNFGVEDEYSNLRLESMANEPSRKILDALKSKVLTKKVTEYIEVTQPAPEDPEDTPVDGGKGPLKALKGKAARFPLQVGHCIFHTGDAVRIFWRDPFKPTDWYFEITGTVSDWRESVEATGRRTVTITVEDASSPLRMARVALNPALYDVEVVANEKFDDWIRNFQTELFQDKGLIEAITALIFGGPTSDVEKIKPPVPLNSVRYSVHDKTETDVSESRLRGAGLFNKEESRIFVYPSAIPTDLKGTAKPEGLTGLKPLESWQKTVDSKVPTDIDELLTLCLPALRDAAKTRLDQAKNIDDIIKEIGEHPEVFPVDFGRLLFLVPKSIGPLANINIFLTAFTDIANQTEFMTRLQIIYSIVERLNFSFYATPRGDLVCEMPLYWSRPEDFGSYSDRYIFTLDDTIGFESHFQHDKVRTLLLSDFGIVPGFKLGDQSQIWIAPGSASVRSLIPQFGIVAERAEPWAFSNSPEVKKYYCLTKLSQLNADAWTQTVVTLIRTGLGPNRPCYFEARDFIATLRKVGSSIVWGKSGSISQQIQINYRRGWAGKVKKGSPNIHIYEPYGGLMADPLDIGLLFDPANYETGNSLSTREQKQLKENLQYTRSVLEKIAAILTSERDRRDRTSGPPIEAKDIVGSTYRSPEEQKMILTQGRGSATSLHPHGLALDLPRSKLSNLGFTTAEVATILKEAMSASMSVPDAESLPEVKYIEDEQDHVHVELKPTAKYRRVQYSARG